MPPIPSATTSSTPRRSRSAESSGIQTAWLSSLCGRLRPTSLAAVIATSIRFILV